MNTMIKRALIAAAIVLGSRPAVAQRSYFSYPAGGAIDGTEVFGPVRQRGADVTLSLGNIAPVRSVNGTTGSVVITPGTISAIPTASINSPNGVAGLGSTGLLGFAQIPFGTAAHTVPDAAAAFSASSSAQSTANTAISNAAAAQTTANGAAQKANNLSDLASVITARTNLGLGGAAVLNVGTTTGSVPDAGAAFAASAAAQTTANSAQTTANGAAQKTNNLSDLSSITTARTNLGLGGAALLNVGTAAGTVPDAAAAFAASAAAQTTANTGVSNAAAAQTTANAALPAASPRIPTGTAGAANGAAVLDANATVSANLVLALDAINSRSLAAMSADRLNALSQGIVGDGTTDNTTALNAACTEAGTAGKVLYLPAGAYIVDGVNFSPCPMVMGDGPGRTIIRRKPSATRGYVAEVLNVGAPSLRDFSVDGNQSGQTVLAPSLFISGDWNADVENVVSMNGNSDGVLVANNADSAHNTTSSFFRVSGTGNAGVGIHLRDVLNVNLLQSAGVANTGNGLDADYSTITAPLSWVGANKNIFISQFSAIDNGKSGIDFPGFITAQSTPAASVNGNGACPSDSVTINGAHAEGNQGYGLVAQGCGFMITGGVFRGNGVPNANGWFGGFFAGVLANADNTMISGNLMDSNEYYGMDAGGCYGCVITGNTVLNNGKHSLSSGGVGINVGAARYTDVDDNTFIGNGFVPGGISALNVTAAGSGYTAPTVSVSGGNGSGAVLVAAESGGIVTAVGISNGGTNWLDPIVTSTGGGCTTQPTYKPVVTQAVITYVAVLTPGAGCSTAPTVTAIDGTGFVGTVTMNAGAITGVTVVNPGQGYVSTATVTFSDPTGTGATATASIGLGNELIAHRLDGTGTINAAGFPIAFDWDASHLRFRGNKFIVDSDSDYCVHVLEDIQYLDVEDNHCSNPLEVQGSPWFDAYWLESTIMYIHNNTTDQTMPIDQHFHQDTADIMTIPDQYESFAMVSAAATIVSIEPEFVANYATSVYAVKMNSRGTVPYTDPLAVATGGGCTTEPSLQVYQDPQGFIANIGLLSNGVNCTTPPTVTITDQAGGPGQGASASAFTQPWANVTGRDLKILINTSGFTFPNTGSRLKLNGPYTPVAGDILHLVGLNPGGLFNEVTRSSPTLQSAVPGTPTACGTGPVVGAGSTDIRGFVTIGTGTVTACTVPFGTTHPVAPFCTASSGTAAVSVAIVPSTTAMALTFSGSLGGGRVAYVCAM